MTVAVTAVDASDRLRMGYVQSLALFVFALFLAWHTLDEISEGLRTYREINRLMSESEFAVKAMAMVQELQRERGLSVGMLANGGALFAQDLTAQRGKTDQRVRDFHQQLGQLQTDEFAGEWLQDLHAFIGLLDRLPQRRREIDGLACSSVEIIDFFHELSQGGILLLSRMTKPFGEFAVTNASNALLNVAQLKESAGMERAILNDAFSRNRFRPGWHQRFLRHVAEQPVFEQAFLRFANQEQTRLYGEKMVESQVMAVARLRQVAMDKSEAFGIEPQHWFQVATGRIDLLHEVERQLSKDLWRASQQSREEALKKLLYHASFSTGILFVAGMGLIYFLIGLHQRYQKAIQNREETASILEDKENLLDKMQDVAHMGDWSAPQGRSNWKISRGCRHILGIGPDYGVTREMFLGLLSAADRLAVEQAMARIVQEGGETEMECRLTTVQGRSKVIYLRMEYFKKNRGEALKGVMLDITQRKEMEEQMRHLAHHDSLTGLPNRMLANDRLSMALATAQRKKCKVAILCMDLDGFKGVNDSLGHDAGDLLLQEVAQRLLSSVRKMDTVARLGGDEFLLVLPELHQLADVVPVASKLIEVLRVPFVIGGVSCQIGVSIGIGVYPDHGQDNADLIKKADVALYAVKEGGKNHYRYYEAAMEMEKAGNGG